MRENLMRGTSFSAVNAAKTHCINGHPFSLENVYRVTSGRYRRQCRLCRKEARGRAAA